MKNENYKYQQSQEEYVERMFIFILFLVTFGLTLFAIFFMSWALDYIDGVNSIPDGWA